MSEETTFEKIKKVSGREPTNCNCNVCQDQCQRSPCLGKPEDILRLIIAGYGERLSPTVWAAGMAIGVIDHPVEIIAPTYDKGKGACTFFKNGRCELHDKNLKPTEGRLSHHSLIREDFIPDKNLTWNIVKEWMNLEVSELKIGLEKICNQIK